MAVVVPATDRPRTLDRCLAAIRAAADGPDETIVVTEAGPGAGAARNAGVARTQAELLVFVDADVVVHADVFSRLRQAFAADPGLGAVFGSYDDTPADPGLVSAFRNLLHHHVHHESPGPASTFWAGLGAVRREHFLAADGFDEKRRPLTSIEDVELGYRLTAAGVRIELRPEIQGTHLKCWTLRTMVSTDLVSRGIPWAEILLTTDADRATLNLGARHRASSLASAALAVSLALGRRRGSAFAIAALLALNHRFYALLYRRRGVSGAAAGVALHAVHHLTGLTALAIVLAKRVVR